MKIAIVTLGLLIFFAAGLVIANAIDIVGTKSFLTYWVLGTSIAAVVLLWLFGNLKRGKKQAS